jgi:hypothetical protein
MYPGDLIQWKPQADPDAASAPLAADLSKDDRHREAAACTVDAPNESV